MTIPTPQLPAETGGVLMQLGHSGRPGRTVMQQCSPEESSASVAIVPGLRMDSTDVTEEEEEAEKENPVSLQPTFQEGLLSTGRPPLTGRECSLTTFPSIHEHAKDSYTKCYVGKKSMQNLHYDDSRRRMCILGRDKGVVLW